MKTEIWFPRESRLCLQDYEPVAIFKLWSQWTGTGSGIETKHLSTEGRDQLMLESPGKLQLIHQICEEC